MVFFEQYTENTCVHADFLENAEAVTNVLWVGAKIHNSKRKQNAPLIKGMR
jgi:hypothetical protein